MSYLKQVALIREVKLLEVSSDVVELSVLVRGSHEAFKQMLVTDARLSLKYQDPTDRKLVYVWAH